MTFIYKTENDLNLVSEFLSKVLNHSRLKNCASYTCQVRYDGGTNFSNIFRLIETLSDSKTCCLLFSDGIGSLSQPNEAEDAIPQSKSPVECMTSFPIVLPFFHKTTMKATDIVAWSLLASLWPISSTRNIKACSTGP